MLFILCTPFGGDVKNFPANLMADTPLILLGKIYKDSLI
jgi:hypothetical protein